MVCLRHPFSPLLLSRPPIHRPLVSIHYGRGETWAILTFDCTGKIDTLKHVKKDVQEMNKGSECGIGFDGFQEFEPDDQVQTYETIEEKRTL